jgi:NAD(P)-dependent dehydrogenase (short-subunit alcohol dehydrogenase family)
MKNLFSYEGKRVVIAGCFSGMGEAAAKILLSLGAEVHGLDYKDVDLPLASFNKVDLRDPASIDAVVKKIGGHVDSVFYAAGLPGQAFPPLDVMKVNFLSARYFIEAMVPLMSKGGSIVSISSTAGNGWSQRIPTNMELITTKSFEEGLKWCENHLDVVSEGYPFSKEALIVWTMFQGSHLIKKGIRINTILPGPTQTPMMKDFEAAAPMAVLEAVTQPINRRSTPEEQAWPLVFLNSDAASYVNGLAFPVDGGFMGGVATGQIDMSSIMGGMRGPNQ